MDDAIASLASVSSGNRRILRARSLELIAILLAELAVALVIVYQSILSPDAFHFWFVTYAPPML